MNLQQQLQATFGDAITIERELGGGGMSRVFVGVESALDRRVVIKVLAPELTADISIARFQREIALVARFQHPHIVPLVAAGETQGLPYYLMPLVDGESLRTRISRAGEMPINEAVRVLREIASALDYAHGKGVVHRDIKPENVLLSGGIALVTDFGVAKAITAATSGVHPPERDGASALPSFVTTLGVALGTPAYMAPEQAAADPATDHRADIYAFGVLAYEMLTGQPPFSGRPTQALLAAHLTESPESVARRRPAVPAPLAVLVMRCLEKRPADRPQHARDIVEALDAITTPTHVSAPTSAPRRVLSRTTVAFLALAVIAATAGGAWLWSTRAARPLMTSSSRLLIAPFRHATSDARLQDIDWLVADRLAQDVLEGGFTDVVPSQSVLQAMRDTSSASIANLATAQHAGRLVVGSATLRADSLVLSAQLIDASTNRVITTMGPVSGPSADPFPVIDSLGDRLLGAIGSGQLTFLPHTVRAPKLAAWTAFYQGFRLFALDGEFRGAQPHFRRAILIDSTYTRAYQLLARVYLLAGDYDSASVVVRRMGQLHGLTEMEQALVDNMSAELRGDLPGQLRALQRAAALEPSPLWFGLVRAVSNKLLRPDVAAAVPVFDSLRGQPLPVGRWAVLGGDNEIAETYHQAEQYARANAVMLRDRADFPMASASILPGGQLRAFAGMHRAEAAIALADTMLREDADSLGQAAAFVTTGALEFRVHGDSAAARRLLDNARRWYASHPMREAPPARSLAEGITLFASGKADSAAGLFAVAARDTMVLDGAGYTALVVAARGDRERAKRMADSLGALDGHRRWLFGANTFWQGAIVGALGDQANAVRLLRIAQSKGQSMASWHYVAALGSLHGYGPFEELIRPRR